eukprot:15058823-Heterocapsa_arctica.AAC.1
MIVPCGVFFYALIIRLSGDGTIRVAYYDEHEGGAQSSVTMMGSPHQHVWRTMVEDVLMAIDSVKLTSAATQDLSLIHI